MAGTRGEEPKSFLVPAGPAAESITTGKFQPNWESLAQYQTPEWFRDAKFGIWAHWTAQCVPEQGDWYARKMYIEGDPDYKYQCAHYGHPSKVGFKDIDHIWKAEHWDPEKLIELYKRAGAKYFVALANHHDNFDCFDSKYQPWNSVKIGPHKDIVGLWAQAARKNGLRFGVTVHASHAWSWFEPAQGSDKDGPLAGVPYDGKLTKSDGQGQWWEGLDPQDLYAQNHKPGKKLVWDWDPSKGSSVPDQAYCDKFFNRTKDLIDQYHPDLVYFDDTVLPLYPISDAGLRIAAHYYNANRDWHQGRLEAVMNTKGLNEEQRRCLVWDIERGLSDRIEPYPWQTDTCLGHWHYERSLFEEHKYKSPDTVLHMLADIVSKNGNLLLNVPVRGDGTIDSEEVGILEEIAQWMDVNREAIFGTRPWKVFGEGPSAESKEKAGNFNEGKNRPHTAADIRFTTKGKVLYAIALGWPTDGKVTIQSLAAHSANYPDEVGNVELLGTDARLQWQREEKGLVISVPAKKPGKHAFVFKITPASEKGRK
ncbi:MAG: alpha-L-fucosidase [Planctomycetes bacterium]|nr:alpha-L-fucosidase [Planctomycetota bacterium]